MNQKTIDKNNPNNFFSVRFFKWYDNISTDKVRLVAFLTLTTLIITYLSSLLSQLTEGGFTTFDRYNNATNYSLLPTSTIPKMFSDGNGHIVLYFYLIVIAIFMFMKMNLPNARYDERGFTISEKGTYGTSGWLTLEEAKKIMKVEHVSTLKGSLFGKVDDKGNVLSFRIEPEFEGDRRHQVFNKNVAVFGASGSGKSRRYVRNHILQCVRRGESMVITDPKSEMFATMAGYLEKKGYKVRVFNLVNPKMGDSWNPINEVMEFPDELELMSQTFSNVVIENTTGENSKGDKFWDNAEMNLLKALVLYIIKDDSRQLADKNFGEVYRLLTSSDLSNLEAIFSALPPAHPALQPWNIFNKGAPQVKGNVITGLGSRLQVFQSESIRKLTASIDIDLTEPGKTKTAIFLIMSDQDNTLSFLSSLFFSFIFIKLVRYADAFCEGQVLPVPVNFILDEFPNIGRIPDFEKKISTVRSRGINLSVIFQNLAQLQNRYPSGTWEEILGNCDAQFFLGCTDQVTAEYISKRTGIMTVEVSSTQVQRKSIALTQSAPTYNSTESIGKRMLLEPDEVLRLDGDVCLLIARGCKVMKLKKFDYAEHPDAKELTTKLISEYVPYRARKKMEEEQAEQSETMENDSISEENIENQDAPNKEKTIKRWETIDDAPLGDTSKQNTSEVSQPRRWQSSSSDNPFSKSSVQETEVAKDKEETPISDLETLLKEKIKKRNERPTFNPTESNVG